MRPTFRARVFLLSAMVAASAWSEPPPPEIQAIIAKLRNKQSLTDEEQARLGAWQRRTTAGPQGDGPPRTGDFTAMPPDVADIMQKTQRGVPPSAAELARLRAWGEETKGKKRQVLQQEQADSALLRGAIPAGATPLGTPKSPFLEGTLRVVMTVDAIAATPTPCPNTEAATAVLRTHEVITSTATVRIKTREPGKPLSHLAEVPRAGPFSVILEGRGPALAQAVGTVTQCESATKSGATVGFTSGELVVGGSRVYLNLVGAQTLDFLLPEVSWQGTAGLNNDFARSYGQAVAKAEGAASEGIAAARGATFSLDPAALRKALQARVGTVSGDYHATMRSAGGTDGVSISFTLDLTPSTSKLEMAFIGDSGEANEQAWADWLPWPWLERDDDAKLFVEARTHDSHAPSKRHDAGSTARVRFNRQGGQPCTLHVEFLKVGQQSGIAANWPPLRGAVTPSLFIPQDVEQTPKVNERWVIAGDQQSAHTLEPVATAELLVAATSTGAYGQLTANCVEDGLQAIVPTTGGSTLSLPRDDNDNHVADGWEDKNGGRKTSGRWDEEPADGMAHAGDGISLFEEYRGFVVQRDPFDRTSEPVFRRLSPKEKEVFVSVQTTSAIANRAVSRGLRAFQATLNLTVVGLAPKYLTPLADAKPDDLYARWANANTPAELLASHEAGGPHDLTATPMVEDMPYSGYYRGKAHAHTESFSAVTDAQSRGPRETYWISLYPADSRMAVEKSAKQWAANATNGFGRKYVSLWLKAHHRTVDAFLKLIREAPVDSATRSVTEDFMTFSITHEFGHAFGVPHHGLGANAERGDLRCPMRYFNDERWDIASLQGEWRIDRALVPPSFAGAYTFDPQAIAGCGDDYCPAKQADALRDFASGPFPTEPWKFDATCLSKMRLWYSNDDDYALTPP